MSGAVFVTLAIGAIGNVSGSVWTPTPTTAPGGPVGIPINTSRSIQTITGSTNIVSLNGGLTVADTIGNPKLTIGSALQPVTLRWNGVDYLNWPGVTTGSYVRLNESAQGWASIQGPNAPCGTCLLSAWNITAGTPSAGSPSYGLYAQDDPSGVGTSYAVYGETNVNTLGSAGIAGYAPSYSSSWAAFFYGNVGLSPNADIFVGGSRTSGDVAAGELCLDDLCRSTFPADLPADNYWTDNSGISKIEVKDVSYDLAIGGTGPGAPFFIDSIPSQSSVDVRNLGTMLISVSPSYQMVIQ